jgi:hypothetical protein
MKKGIPPEFMHLVCCGMAKRLVNSTFGLSKHITINTEAKMDQIESLLELLKVPDEMARRPRPIHLSHYKSQVIIIQIQPAPARILFHCYRGKVVHTNCMEHGWSEANEHIAVAKLASLQQIIDFCSSINHKHMHMYTESNLPVMLLKNSI